MDIIENKKLIKIGFYGFLEPEIPLYVRMLEERYEVQSFKDLTKCDYLFVGPYGGKKFGFPLLNNQIRIFITNEPMTPWISIFDYMVGFEVMNLIGDDGKPRYFRYPFSLKSAFKQKDNICWGGLTKANAESLLKSKTGFCNFMYSHASPDGHREALFEAINKYKKVDSAGTFMNNMPDGFTVDRTKKDTDKLDFVKNYKFTIAADSIIKAGFCTEKITHAFVCNSIPIYWGDPMVSIDFNPHSFVNAADFESLDKLVERIEYLDTHDEEYIKMLMEPKLINSNSIEEFREKYKQFLFNIFDQPLGKAFRRCRDYYDITAEKELSRYIHIYSILRNSKLFKIVNFFKHHK